MKRTTMLMGLALSGFLYACSDSSIDFVSQEETTITGNLCKLNTPSGETVPTGLLSSLPAGSRVLLNASGSLQLTDRVFTYSGLHWTADGAVRWSDTADSTQVTALYPVLTDYTRENLYPNGRLQDVLCMKDTFPARQEINLKFGHLFSCLTFRISPKLKKELKTLSLTTPATVASVSPESAEITLASESHTASVTADGADTYSFLIPPAKDAVLTLTLKTDGSTVEKKLKAQNFYSNHQYVCNVKTLESLPGIETAEDLISFTRLINQDKSYNGDKTLEDFGDTQDGVTTYRLLNDISLTPEQCARLGQPICGMLDNQFNAIFDGQGYTIDGLIPASAYKSSGLFGFIGKQGIVKNLTLTNARSEKTDETNMSILCGNNNGTILNCSLKDCTLSATGEGTDCVGLFAANSAGDILNCSAQDCTLTGGGAAGGAAGMSRGNIINCFFTGIRLSGYQSYGGGICGKGSLTTSSTIQNCYIECAMSSQKSAGTIIGLPGKVTADYCFYKTLSKYSSFGEDGGIKKLVRSYNDDFITNIDNLSVLEKLNEWVDDNATHYPELYRWKQGDTASPAVFIK